MSGAGDDDGQEVDAIIMPVAPHAAVIPGRYYHLGYTEVVNLLNYSAAVIPVTKADRGVDAVDEAYEPVNKVDRANWETCEYLILYGVVEDV